MTWDPWYVGLRKDDPQPFGDVQTYEKAAEFLADCTTVADWGCGKGWFSTLIESGYIGIDGTQTPFADVVVNLTEYRSETEGILLRHVLEHNEDWATILSNAAASATHKLCIVLFTPCGDRTKQIGFTEDLGVPDLSFALPDLLKYLDGFVVGVEHLRTNTQYGEETIIRAVRR